MDSEFLFCNFRFMLDFVLCLTSYYCRLSAIIYHYYSTKRQISTILQRGIMPTMSFHSVRPSKRRANPDRRTAVNMKVKEACNEIDVKFVDNDANFKFRNRVADDAAFQRDGVHLSESGVGRLPLNLSPPEQPSKHYQRQHQ